MRAKNPGKRRKGKQRRPGNPVKSQPAGAKSLLSKIIFSAITTCLFFFAVEAILFLLGVRPILETEDPYVGFASGVPLFVEQTSSSGEIHLATAQNKLPFFNPQEFGKAKRADSFRIFCVGGSTTYGRPYDDNTSFCGWLREILRAAEPSRNWEVINAGGISYASYRVAALMQELAQYSPDLFIVYSGHNEFLERRTYGKISERHPLVKGLDSTLMRTRTYSLLKSVMQVLIADPATKARERYQMTGEVETLLDQSVGPSSYTRDDAFRRSALNHYRLNLDRMVNIARGAGSAILFVNPASNLKDSSPFKSDHLEILSSQQKTRFRKLSTDAEAAQEEGRLTAALEALREMVHIDERFAAAHYRLGQVLFELGRFEQAEAAFQRALDEDVCPLRALSPMQGIIREVARIRRVPIVDFREILEENSFRKNGHRILGREFLLDHVHPTIEANRMLAVALVEELVRERIVRAAPGWRDEAVRTAGRKVESRIDRRSHGIALRNLAKVLSWAGKTDEAGRLAAEATKLLENDAETLFYMGNFEGDRNRLNQAIEYYRRAVQADPNYFEAHNNLGMKLVQQGEIDQAIVHYKEALRINPDHGNAQYNLGIALVLKGRLEEAARHISRVLSLKAHDPKALSDAHYHLGRIRYMQNDLAGAEAEFGQTLRLTPEHWGALYALGEIRSRQGRWVEAVEHFNEVVRLRPGFAPAHRQFARVLARLARREEAIAHYRIALQIQPDWPSASRELAELIATQ